MITTINEFKKFYNYNLIPGGLAAHKTVKNIAKKYNVNVEEVISKIKKGIKVEMEHTSDERIATEIAMDHLMEMFDYYEKLETIEESKELKTDEPKIQDQIVNSKKLSGDLKNAAMRLKGSLTKYKNGVVTGLNLSDELIKKIKDNNYPSGFSMGIDKNGYFIHTHRARGKSYEQPDKIPASEIKFIDSTG